MDDCILLLLLAMLSVVAVGGQYTHRTYVTATDPASLHGVFHCHGYSNETYTRCCTLTELIDSVSEGQSAFQSHEEVVFQSGLHVVSGTNKTSIAAIKVTGLAWRGESGNVTVLCTKEFHFEFSRVSNVMLAHMTIKNCFYQIKTPKLIELTMTFIRPRGSIGLNGVQIASDSMHKAVVNILFKSTYSFHVQLANIKLSNTKVYIGPYVSELASGEIEIINSTFVDSCIEISTNSYTCLRNFPCVIVKNSSFLNASCECALAFTTVHANVRVPLFITLEDVKFTENSSPYLLRANIANVSFKGISNQFHRNKGVIYIEQQTQLLFSGTAVEFVNNTVTNAFGVPLYASNSVINFTNCHVIFENNHGLLCGAIAATEATLLVFGANSTLRFENNEGQKGGALSLSKQSVLKFDTMHSKRSLILEFVSNLALYGGAVFVKDNDYLSTIGRNLTMSIFDSSMSENTKLVFSNNIAQVGGNQIYGGWIDWSVGKHGEVRYNKNVSQILQFDTDRDVASDPTRVCVCINGLPDCTIIEQHKVVYGQAFSIDLVAVGQRQGRVTAFVETSVKEIPEAIPKQERFQSVQRECTTLRYSVTSALDELTFLFKPLKKNYPSIDSAELQQHPGVAILFKEFSVKVKMKQCPIGFNLSSTKQIATVLVKNRCQSSTSSVTLIPIRLGELNDSGLECHTNTPHQVNHLE